MSRGNDFSMHSGVRRRGLDVGMTLVELMVALAIGSFLMLGALTVYLHGRATFQLNESISRLQENGRFALDAIEPDIRMAHYWGLTTRTSKVQGRATPADPVTFDIQGDDCGVNWSVDLEREIDGANDAYDWDCAVRPTGAQPQADSDTLVIRRAAENPTAAPAADTLYVQSARFKDSQLFVGPTLPAGYAAATSESHELVVDGYYVSRSSTLGADVPSLRVKRLGSGPRVTDEEVLPGVEDMQVQFGIDTDAAGAANRGSIDRYVNPGDGIIDPGSASFNPDAQILAVRIWLRIRAQNREPGFADDKTYVYADQNIAAPMDAYRRIVVSKTIYIRNARPPV